MRFEPLPNYVLYFSPLISFHCADLMPMPFMVRGFHNNHPLTLTSETAKEAFAKAIEWHLVEGFTDISISDDIKEYTIAEFAALMAIKEIDKTMHRE
jgi:hypothetical protein